MRRGSLMLELLVSIGLLSALVVVCLQLVSAVGRQSKTAEHRQLALLELGNVLERITARPWEELTTSALAAETLSATATTALTDGRLQLDVAPSVDGRNGKRIRATLQWREADAADPLAVTLTTWRHRLTNR